MPEHGLFCIGRQPYMEPLQRHDLGRMDLICEHCGAAHWLEERLSKSSARSPKFGACCMEGKVQLPVLSKFPEPLRTLLISNQPVAAGFWTNIWKYNRALSFTSLGVTEDHSIDRGCEPPVFPISGELHHYSAALTLPDGRLPRYAQLYIYKPGAALDAQMQQNVDLNREIMSALQ